ncbi:MAG: hypothetical protein J6B81_02085 [Spirochaetaceae bacterium]|nr:hypothetical protein [Spirochaetaceae bacterium]
MKKNTIIFILILFSVCSIIAEGYQIIDAEYNISGRTREYALNKSLDIQKNKVFSTKQDLEQYIAKLSQTLTNQRVLETSAITYTEGEPNTEGIIPVTLYIDAKDTWNILPIPYPKYNSNTGLELKIKVKDFNFFGTMEPLDFEISYFQEDEGTKHNLGIGFDFTIPFPIWKFDAEWDLSAEVDYTIGENKPDFSVSTGFSLAFPLSFATFNLIASQSVTLDSEYEDAGDDLFFNEYVELNVPLTILQTNSIANNLVFTPYVSFNFNWDKDKIQHEDLLSPILSFGASFSLGNVDWIENFRKGISFNLTQDFAYNFGLNTNRFAPCISSTLEAFYATEYVAFNSRVFAFTYFGMDELTKNEIGGRIRGVSDLNKYNSSQVDTSSAIVVNMDIPVKVIKTDWRGWGKNIFKKDMPNWFGVLDFELQLSPFVDLALINNTATNTLFNPKDGLYGGGIEVIVYPLKMRSIQVRGSVGIDLGQFLLDADWRDGPKSEIEIGIGLHY